MDRKEAIDRTISLERSRQEELIEKEMKDLRWDLKKVAIKDRLLFFRRKKAGDEYRARISHLHKNKDAIIDGSLMYLYREKDVLEKVTREHRNELKGYYGELLVMDSLRQLSDDYYVLCDVRISRESGYRFDGKMLKSARVDHIVVGRKGVFCIETKNWNSRWKYEDKPTPGEQARRASHLLYKYLKFARNLKGVKVMSIVLYTNTAIKGREDFVRFLRYDEFEGYLAQRPDIMSDSEVRAVVECIKDRDVSFDDSFKDEGREDIKDGQPALDESGFGEPYLVYETTGSDDT
jgi:hypothetical protein